MANQQSRRAFLSRGALLGGTALVAGPVVAGGSLVRPDVAGAADRDAPPTNPDEALERLLAGNRRFVRGNPKQENRDAVRRIEVAEGQKPFAVVLGCADSRVPPEVVFDQGLGDIFIVRIAGNTANFPEVVGSIEYGAAKLGAVLVMVLGHDECGAVHAAVDVATKGETLPGEIGAFVEPVIPAVEEVRDAPESQLLDQATRANIRRTVAALQSDHPLLTDLVNTGKLKVVGGEYQLKSGKVDMVVQ